MSHPWKAQPYYMTLEPRTSGMVPAPMGAYVQGLGGLRVHEALAGYTRGSFAPKSPWATPEYVASEPTGVDGYTPAGCGLGQTTAGCLDPAEAADALLKAFNIALANVQVPEKSVGIGPMSTTIGGKPLSAYDVLRFLKSLVAAGISEFSDALNRGADAAKAFFKKIMKTAITKAVPGIGGQIAGLLDSEGLLDKAADEVWSALLGDIGQVPVCKPTAVDVEVVKASVATPLPTLDWATVQRARAQAERVGGSSFSQIRAIRAITPARTVPTTRAGVSTPVIIGAAALAALLLLR